MLDNRGNPQSENVEAYLRDIKELLEKHYGKYVVYQSGQQVLISGSRDEAYHALEERGLLKNKPTLVQKIEPLEEIQVIKLRSSRVVRELRD